MPSIWPPQDFELEVEEFAASSEGLRAVRSFLVLADGTALYRLAPEALADPDHQFVLPVFRVVSGYRLLRETTRILARQVTTEGFVRLDPVQGDQRVTGGTSFKVSYRGFEEQKVVVASGMIHGALVRVLRAINSFLPPGERFAPVGMTGEREPARLRGVPAPADDLAGALAFTDQLALLHPQAPALQLEAFALACRAGARAQAEQALDRWERATAATAPETPAFPEPGARLSRAQLERLLPSK